MGMQHFLMSLYFSLFQAQKRELDHIRQNYRKNSLARSPTSEAAKAKSDSAAGKASAASSAAADPPPFVLLSSESGGGPGGGGMGGSDEED